MQDTQPRNEKHFKLGGGEIVNESHYCCIISIINQVLNILSRTSKVISVIFFQSYSEVIN